MARSYEGHSKVKSDEGTAYLCCDNVVGPSDNSDRSLSIYVIIYMC